MMYSVIGVNSKHLGDKMIMIGQRDSVVSVVLEICLLFIIQY